MTPQQASANALSIRKMVTAILIAEYAMTEFRDGTKQDLKVRVNNAIASCRRVQQWFTQHPCATEETRAQFKKDFLGGEMVLLSAILERLFTMSEEGLEEVIRALDEAQAA
ncbi:hypothetical protein JMG10_07690 [Nostoc ellipsosporum NOK]|nr:hypothetical protein [Nostoc ellipsosporum NOK]